MDENCVDGGEQVLEVLIVGRGRDKAAYEAEAEREKKPENPKVYFDDFAENINIVDRDEGFPAFFAGFGEDFPFGDNEEDIKDEDDDRDAADNTAEG